jgi:excinuclease ABC subunit C
VLRGRALTASELDAIPGVGPVRRTRLLRAFGSVASLRGASVEEIAGIEGIGRQAAEAVHRHLHGAESDGAPQAEPGRE